MKEFKLVVDGKEYIAYGDSLDKVEGWEKGLPKIWQDNSDSIVERDITAEMEEKEESRKIDRKLERLMRRRKIVKHEIARLEAILEEEEEEVVAEVQATAKKAKKKKK